MNPMKRRFRYGLLSLRFAGGLPPARRLLRLAALTIAASGSLVLLAGIALFVLAQTSAFNRWLAEFLQQLLRDELAAELTIGSVRVDVFRGIELDSVALVAGGDTVFAAPHVELLYVPEALLFRSVSIARLHVDSPRIHIARRRDSTWNVEHILRPHTSPPSEPPSLLVYVRSFAIRNGSVTVEDSLSVADTSGHFDPLHLRLSDVEVGATVLAHLRQQRYAIAFDRLSWYDERSGWAMRRALGTVEADTAELRVPMLALVFPSSQVELERAAVRYTEPTLPLSGRIRVALDPNDARYVLPAEAPIGAPVTLDAEVEGTADSVHIARAELASGSTVIRGSGRAVSLGSPDRLRWSADIERSEVRWNDVRRLAIWLRLPAIPALENCRIERITARGSTDSLVVGGSVATMAGTIEGNARLALTGSTIGYDIEGKTSALDLASFDTTLPRTSLHAVFTVIGSGTTPERALVAARVRLDSSSIERIGVEHATIVARIERGALVLDTLAATLDRHGTDGTPTLSAQGSFEFSAPHRATFLVESEHLPLDRMLGSTQLPALLSARVQLESTGATLDSLRVRLDADIAELVFQDRAVFPFELGAVFDFDSDGSRVLQVRSPQIEARIVGRYTLPGLERFVSGHLQLVDTLMRRIVARAEGRAESPLAPMIGARDTIDAEVTVRAKSLSLLAPLLAPTVVEAEATLVGRISAAGNRSRARFDSLDVKRLIVSMPDGFYLASMPARGSVALELSALDRTPHVDAADIRLAVDSVLRVGTFRIVRPSLRWQWNGMRLHIATDTAWLENTMPLALAATIVPEPDGSVSIAVERLCAGLSETFSWCARSPLSVRLDPSGQYVLDRVQLFHEQSDAMLDLDGQLGADGIEALRIVLRNFDLRDLTAIPALGAFELVQHVSGTSDSLTIGIEGQWQRPRIWLYGSMRDIAYGDLPIGDHRFTFSYDGSTLLGNAAILVSQADGSERTAFELRIESLPLAVSLAPLHVSVSERKPIAIYATAHKLSLAIVEPFLPALSQMRGTADLQLSITGSLPGSIVFRGKAEYDDCEFLVAATNIRYRSRGVIVLDDNVLRLEPIELFNDPADLVGGTARITGTVTLRDFQPDALDISITIPGERGFLVMSNATAAVNNTMYGRVVISTEEDNRLRQLHLSGTIERPRLGGFLRIEDADVTFPPTTAVTVQTSSFTYRKVGAGYVVTDAVEIVPRSDTTIGDLPPRSGTPSAPVRLSITPGFAERLYTAVDVKIRRQMRVKMDFSSVEQLVAFVEQENRAEYLRFVRDGTRRTELRGTLVVDPSSTYKFYSTFTASGRLRFTTGAIDNPEVDLRAVYDGERLVGSDNRRERYRVILFITGTKSKPRVRMTYEINGEEAPGTRGDSVRIMTNALLLVLFGRTQEELTGGTGGAVTASAIDQSVNAARSAAISAFLTNALQGGVIKNVNIDFGSSDVTSLSQARIMLTGQLFGANVTVGGSVADLAQNSQITLDLSIGNTLGIEWLRNLVAQFQATANPGQSLSRQQKQWEFRLGWRVP